MQSRLFSKFTTLEAKRKRGQTNQTSHCKFANITERKYLSLLTLETATKGIRRCKTV